MTVLVSVIVPVYDIGTYLGHCLRSLAHQDLGPDEYEVIVIDDGSTDDSLRVAQSFAADDPRFKVHTQANQGVSAARNKGLDLANGDYVYFVDGDDYIAAGVLAPLMRLVCEHQLEVLGVRFLRVKPGDIDNAVHQPVDIAPAIDIIDGIDYMARVDYPSNVWQYVIDRKFLERIGVRFEVGRVMEDGLFMATVLSSARRMAVIPWDVVRYVLRPDSIMRDRSDEHAARMVADYERVIVGLHELRQRTLADKSATPGFLDRLELRQETYALGLVGRLIRSRLPIRPTLPAVLARLRGLGVYPFTVYQHQPRAPMSSRVLVAIFNRSYLLYPSASTFRVADALRVRLAQRRR